MPEEGYEDIQEWKDQQSKLFDEQANKQREITNQQTEMTIDDLKRQRNKIDTEVNKTTSGLYTNYQKNVNNYGVQAEQQARMGLANSGYAETSRINLYNAYQKNVTDTINNANQLKADFDFKMAEARKQGDLTIAQNELALLQQNMQLLTQEYEMKNNRRQFLYQQERDKTQDSQWQKNYDLQKDQWQQSFDYQKNRDTVKDQQWQTAFDYQKQRDAVSDSQWEKQYELSKKASASSSRGGSSGYYSVSRGTSDDNYEVNSESSNENSNKPSQDEVGRNAKFIQGVSNEKDELTGRAIPYVRVKDGLTGKVYNSMAELMESYGY